MKTKSTSDFIYFILFSIAWVGLLSYLFIATPKGDKQAFVIMLAGISFIGSLIALYFANTGPVVPLDDDGGPLTPDEQKEWRDRIRHHYINMDKMTPNK